MELSIGLMDMAKHADFGLDPIDRLNQLFATSIDAFKCLVKDLMRRSVSNKDVGPLRDKVPLLPDLLASFKVKGPVMIPWLPRTSIEVDSLYTYAIILKVCAVCQPRPGSYGVPFKGEVMIACNYDLVLNGKLPKPLVKALNLFLFSLICEVTRMHQNVNIRRYHKLAVHGVSVRDETDLHNLLLRK